MIAPAGWFFALRRREAGAAERAYAKGLAHGIETTLRLLLGQDVGATRGCPGPIPPNVETWARDALKAGAG